MTLANILSTICLSLLVNTSPAFSIGRASWLNLEGKMLWKILKENLLSEVNIHVQRLYPITALLF